MQPTHFLYLIVPPRQTFVFDASEEEFAIMSTHQKYLAAAAERGLVLLAGPTLDGVWGVSVLNTPDLAVAEEFSRNDPAVSSGPMKAQLHPWKASIRAAGL